MIAIRDAASDCLVIAMAHTDTVPPAPGADDNASGVGTLVALARSLARGPEPACDVWLVATGAEERPYTGQPNHLGASALAARLRRTHRLDDVRVALSLDEVGRGTKFDLHSTASAPREDVERRILDAPGGAAVRWVQDPAGEGNSDHRELARAGAPAAKLGVVDEPCRHTACDTPDRLERGAFTRVLKLTGRSCGRCESRLIGERDQVDVARASVRHPSTLPPGSVTKASSPTPSIAVAGITIAPPPASTTASAAARSSTENVTSAPLVARPTAPADPGPPRSRNPHLTYGRTLGRGFRSSSRRAARRTNGSPGHRRR